jgi:hypothetical protein
MKKSLPYMAVAAVFIAAFFLDSTSCILKNTVGIPCPSCGMTRAYLLLFNGDIKGAFHMHPLFPLIPVTAGAVLVSYFTKFKMDRLYILLALAFFVVYIVRMIGLFPHTPPMDYNYNSIFYRLFF